MVVQGKATKSCSTRSKQSEIGFEDQSSVLRAIAELRREESSVRPPVNIVFLARMTKRNDGLQSRTIHKGVSSFWMNSCQYRAR